MDPLVGYSQYLKDFSLLEEHQSSEVFLWKNLFIWAALFGITGRIAEAFEKLYPHFQDETGFSPSTIASITAFSHGFSQSYESTQVSSSGSSGSGGSTSSFRSGGGSFSGGTR